MKISIVIPLFNKQESVTRAVNSVLSQTEQDFELIIVNDGSTDLSVSRITGFLTDQRIRLIDQPNAGVSAARNRGAAEAQSDIIAFLDADDEWQPEFLEIVLVLRSRFTDASVFGTSYTIQEKGSGLKQLMMAPFFGPGDGGYIENYLDMLQRVLPFNNSSFAVTKEAFQEVGGFPVGIKFGEDVDTWIRLSLRYQIAYLNKSLAVYHRDAENRACDLYYPSMSEYYPVKNLVQLLKRGEVPTHLKQSAVEYIAKYQVSFASANLYHGHPGHARELLDSCRGTRIYLVKSIFLYLCTFVPPDILQSLIKIKNASRAVAQ
jgi:glycosyltransferase involved in cell wall biosynthesis